MRINRVREDLTPGRIVEQAMTDGHHLRDNPARYYEVLGRVMSALRETGALNGAAHLDWWPGNGGRTWEIEWQGGPFPAEVAARLLGAPEPSAQDDQGDHAVRGLISPGRGENERAHLVVLDVPVNLRALDPIGTSQVWAAFTLTQG